jgi:aryl-alcohol dehydrogenase-like predicted oxidoreductase
VTNTRGSLSDDDVAAIVETALGFGIQHVDTHRSSSPEQGYGDAQSRLRPWADAFSITTKVYGSAAADRLVSDQLAASLGELGVTSVRACLVHDWSTLNDREAALSASLLAQAQESGMVDAIGISAYDEHDIERAASFFDQIGALQVPLNVLDQRLCTNSTLQGLRSAGARIQVRSVFLQGLLADATASTPLGRHPDIVAFHDACHDRDIAPLDACLSFVRSVPWVDEVVVGVTSAAELSQIAEAWNTESAPLDWSAMASTNVDLLDPRRWATMQA